MAMCTDEQWEHQTTTFYITLTLQYKLTYVNNLILVTKTETEMNIINAIETETE